MKYLYKVFYEKDNKDFMDIYTKRIFFDSSIRFNLTINPINQPETFDLYYIPTNEMIDKISKIHRLSAELNNIYESLPDVAKEQFFLERIVEELHSTNELEGVRSTKGEIARSVRNVKLNKGNKKRFHSMVKSYFNLINGDIGFPKDPTDIRRIYDEITKDEIDMAELPDGEVFRKEHTYILKKSGSGKIIHRGITPEKEIHSKLTQLLDFMNNSREIPLLIRSAIGHYYFGYIHPFYDGNGRTSRFISSIYLTEELNHVSALSLSQGCNKFTNKYLESFEIANSIMNRGEMNHFIDTYLAIIFEALNEMLSDLKVKDELLKMALQKIEEEPKLITSSASHKNFMFVLAQNYFFHFSDGVTVKELSSALWLSTSTIRKIAKELIDMSLIEQKGIRPAFYTIKERYFERSNTLE